MLEDPVTTALCDELREREAKGIRTYGHSISDAPLTRLQLLQNAKKEALNLAISLQRLIDMEQTA